MTKPIIAALIVLFAVSANAQTRKIAFESHSGSPENFSITLADNSIEGEESNYGLPSHKTVYKIDKVIFISDSQSVIVSKKYDRPFLLHVDTVDKFIGEARDTVVNHYLFNRKISPDSLKKLLQWNDHFEVNDKTKFINADKQDKKQKDKPAKNPEGTPKEQFIPLAVSNDSNQGGNSPFDRELVLMLAGTFILALLGGLLSWKLYRPRLQQPA